MADSRPDTWSITVVRSGGFAGLKREWRAGSADSPDVDWANLVDACPWKAVAKPTRVVDGFVWTIEASRHIEASRQIGATRGVRSRRATLPEAQVTGAWRDLVDQVRQASK